MPEGGQRRHQLDVARGAVIVQFQNVVGGQRRVVAPCLGQIAEQVGVLDVQLPLVDLAAAQQICHALQIVQLRHTPARAVQIVPAVRQIRPVLDEQARQHRAAALHQLDQRLHAVAQGFVIPGGHRHALGRNGDCIMARGLCGIQAKGKIPLRRFPAPERGAKPRVVTDSVAQHLRVQERAGRRPGTQDDAGMRG